jgi:AraC-like DNA-binding protein
MSYREFLPAEPLREYIEAYWTIRASGDSQPVTERIIPDTCNDIIINLGAPLLRKNRSPLESEKSYLIGVMTTFTETSVLPGAEIWGVRFKPFCMHLLLGVSMKGTADEALELGLREFDFKKILKKPSFADIPFCLNAFFGSRLKPKDPMHGIVKSIELCRGNIRIGQLARQHGINERALERLFETRAGITAKELCRQVRFRSAMRMIRERSSESLLDIAFQTGYYDHSHLGNEFKRYTGYSPADHTF